jgi:predicted RNA methylase
MQLVQRLTQRLRTDGLSRSLGALVRYGRDHIRAWDDFTFDQRYGTQTASVGSEKVKYNDLLGPYAADNQGHQPIQGAVFRRIMSDLKEIVVPSQFAFIDLGSGRGRAVLMAAESGFQSAIGIEFSRQLHSCAEDNARAFRLRSSSASAIDFRLMDATEFSFPDKNIVCFLYNPFGPRVMNIVLSNIRTFLDNHSRRFYLVYRNPVLAPDIEDWGFLQPAVKRRSHIIYRAVLPRTTLPLSASSLAYPTDQHDFRCHATYQHHDKKILPDSKGQNVHPKPLA